jgi:hypothetical protein
MLTTIIVAENAPIFLSATRAVPLFSDRKASNTLARRDIQHGGDED